MGGLGSRGVIVTAAAAGAGGYDFVSRYVAPAAGIDEDPVIGSAHCTLGPFWAERLGRKELELTGFQASARGGLVQVRPDGDRVHPGGRAVTVLRASWSDARAGSRQGSRSRPPGAGRPGRPG
jgi:predicted PhzF superfamily epimerase YddE/YHI9